MEWRFTNRRGIRSAVWRSPLLEEHQPSQGYGVAGEHENAEEIGTDWTRRAFHRFVLDV
jgi:hypothetical protein